jgi:hypothetical protein
MAGIQKAFLKQARTRWQREFPILRPVHLIEVPQPNKGTNFICDRYFLERGRTYFICFDFIPKRFGEFTIGVTVSDSLTRSILEHGTGEPSPTAIGMYAIGPFIGAPSRRWALIDHNAQADEFFRSLGVEPVGFAGMRDPYTWYPSSFGAPQEQIFDAALDDVNGVLRQQVFPKLQIEYENPSG